MEETQLLELQKIQKQLKSATKKLETMLGQKERKDPKIKISYTKLMELWNSVVAHETPVQKITEISYERKLKIDRLIKKKKERDDFGYWEALFKKIRASRFLCGFTTDWKISFDWLLIPGNFLKVEEGNYSDHKFKKDRYSEGLEELFK